MASTYHLAAVVGEDRGREWTLTEGKNVIGRGSDAAVQLRDSRASRAHCVIVIDGDSAVIEDLGSTNATLLDGRPVQRQSLVAGSHISVGDTELLFKVAAEEGPALDATTVLRNEIRGAKLHDFERELLSHGLVGRSAAIRRVLDTIARIAPTDATVLVTGPSGSGKELVATALHYNSPRREGQFVSVNCAAIPESLIESELFGHERGAFTGASSSRSGKFQHAHGGTLFLDEIGDMPLACQSKLLRVLQDRTYSRLGSNEVERTDCRVVAATNRDIEKSVEDKSFREDLYFRINVIRIEIPPLAARRDDIDCLAGHFLEKLCAQYSMPAKHLSAEAVQALTAYDWPGNVRELQSCLERAVLLGGSTTIAPADLRLGTPRPAVTESAERTPDFVPRSLREIEKEHVLRVLEHTQGNKKRAAEILGIERNTLYDKLRQYGLPDAR